MFQPIAKGGLYPIRNKPVIPADQNSILESSGSRHSCLNLQLKSPAEPIDQVIPKFDSTRLLTRMIRERTVRDSNATGKQSHFISPSFVGF